MVLHPSAIESRDRTDKVGLTHRARGLRLRAAKSLIGPPTLRAPMCLVRGAWHARYKMSPANRATLGRPIRSSAC